jgi:hypothetical protein
LDELAQAGLVVFGEERVAPHLVQIQAYQILILCFACRTDLLVSTSIDIYATPLHLDLCQALRFRPERQILGMFP